MINSLTIASEALVLRALDWACTWQFSSVEMALDVTLQTRLWS